MTKARETRGRARCVCGAIMCQSNGGALFCPYRHTRGKRPRGVTRIRKYHELSKSEKKQRRENLRKAHRHERPTKKGGFRAKMSKMMGR